MRRVIVFALFAGIGLLAPKPASALPPTLIDNAKSPASIAVEQVARKQISKRKAQRYARRYDWTARRYWRPYQYRYWKYYYPYGGPLF